MNSAQNKVMPPDEVAGRAPAATAAGGAHEDDSNNGSNTSTSSTSYSSTARDDATTTRATSSAAGGSSTSSSSSSDDGSSSSSSSPTYPSASTAAEARLIERHRHANGYTSRRVSVRERVSHFTWAWFECTMSTGAVATLLGQQPHTFPGLQTIGTVFFILDLVLFVAFTCLITARFVMHPGALRLSLHHPHESFYFGTFWISIALIIYGTQEYGVPNAGPWLVRALEILFWCEAAGALLVVIFQYHIIFDEEELPVKDAMPTWLLPAYPFLVLGPLAAVLESSQPLPSATSVFIGGLVFEGLGWSVAFIMYTVYFTRLINSKLPTESKRPGMFVAVGPAGYTSSTLAALGMQAPRVIPADYLGLSVPTGELWKAMAVPAAMFVWLVGFWFFALAVVSCLRGARRMYFTLSWWAFVFPNAGLTLGAIMIANAINSPGIKWLCSAVSALIVAVWLGVAAMNIRAVWKRQVLWPGADEDMEDLEGRLAHDKARHD
ncbi:hypothetical protein PFICI_13394 [Pestalotiopsis fici W106-1]|uniref:Malic acid transport protein n=1 Tax=Pestalotiopsis fici (strain W106-1 / CGMCC3.15140) TaxID=1229662 RepID=W3WLV9_PESFW|nr:uncharacterized protein PFICI_13394 [Pestalotiopsis fici W106-1]ETS74910.1 hypothetical protein PFICI_13394 [Pestalotiopsis fici W106-1]